MFTRYILMCSFFCLNLAHAHVSEKNHAHESAPKVDRHVHTKKTGHAPASTSASATASTADSKKPKQAKVKQVEPSVKDDLSAAQPTSPLKAPAKVETVDFTSKVSKTSKSRAKTEVKEDVKESHAENVPPPQAAGDVHQGADRKSVEPEKALRWLQNGNIRFNNSHLRNDGQSRKDVKRVSSLESPHSVVISCSDSRVPPEVVFDQKLGEVFVVRTGGQALDDNAIGSVEYAIEHLGSRLIVVMGHTSCSAVNAAFNTLDGSSVGTPAIDGLVKDIHPRLSHFKGMAASPKMLKESWANAQGVASDLTSRSSVIRSKFESGVLQIVPAMYDLESGKVTFRSHLQPAFERTPASVRK